ncbi:MAG: BMP family ABC transporter substrate-binding protein [Lactimicrobium sp.]|jgi:basic membrane protein A|uniref:BMP family lipoprotein n=1 Tax=Lactimicrobium sp. TaxID=2563780 RepID=UPI002F354E3D
MKKFLTAALAGFMSISLAACGSSSSGTAASSSSSAASGSSDSSDMKVAMITDYGDITDQSFNQTTYEASKAWAEKNGAKFNYYKPASDADADREASIEQAIEEGYNIIVMPGYAFAKAIVDEADNYPDVKFVGIDVSQSDLDTNSNETGWTRDNTYTAVYQEELPGYMAGYAAVKLGYKKLGYLGGMAVPAVIRYGYGYVQGANEAAKELGLSDVEIKYVYGGAFAGNADITAAMDTWFSGGTELVFAAGGSIYTSAAEAAAKVNGKLIGVDVDQAATIDGKYGEGMTVTSAMKGLAATVNAVLDGIKAGKWDSDYAGKADNLGLVSGTDLSKNYVQLADSTQWGDGFTEDDYKELVSKLYNGDLKVDNDTTVDLSKYDGVVKVDYQGSLK